MFVTRAHHDEVVAELKRQLAEKETERQKLWDVLAKHQFGGKIFSPDEIPEAKAAEIEAVKEEIRENLLASVHRNPSRLASAMSAQREREFQRKHSATPTDFVARLDSVSQNSN